MVKIIAALFWIITTPSAQKQLYVKMQMVRFSKLLEHTIILHGDITQKKIWIMCVTVLLNKRTKVFSNKRKIAPLTQTWQKWTHDCVCVPHNAYIYRLE
jgi:hypothetical protein